MQIVPGIEAFPTGVGMNRRTFWPEACTCSVPHGRGDDPQVATLENRRVSAFPTGVGMNRQNSAGACRAESVPHGRGDEPLHNLAHSVLILRSPRAWG